MSKEKRHMKTIDPSIEVTNGFARIDDLKPNPNRAPSAQARDEDVEDILISLDITGQHVLPLFISPDGTIRAGHRRWRAYLIKRDQVCEERFGKSASECSSTQLDEIMWNRIPVIVVADEDRDLLEAVENGCRRGCKPSTILDVVRRLLPEIERRTKAAHRAGSRRGGEAKGSADPVEPSGKARGPETNGLIGMLCGVSKETIRQLRDIGKLRETDRTWFEKLIQTADDQSVGKAYTAYKEHVKPNGKPKSNKPIGKGGANSRDQPDSVSATREYSEATLRKRFIKLVLRGPDSTVPSAGDDAEDETRLQLCGLNWLCHVFRTIYCSLPENTDLSEVFFSFDDFLRCFNGLVVWLPRKTAKAIGPALMQCGFVEVEKEAVERVEVESQSSWFDAHGMSVEPVPLGQDGRWQFLVKGQDGLKDG